MSIALPDVRVFEPDEDIWQRPASEIAERLGAVFATRSADAWQSLLLEAGLSPAETAGLAAAGVLWQESVT